MTTKNARCNAAMWFFCLFTAVHCVFLSVCMFRTCTDAAHWNIIPIHSLCLQFQCHHEWLTDEGSFNFAWFFLPRVFSGHVNSSMVRSRCKEEEMNGWDRCRSLPWPLDSKTMVVLPLFKFSNDKINDLHGFLRVSTMTVESSEPTLVASIALPGQQEYPE